MCECQRSEHQFDISCSHHSKIRELKTIKWPLPYRKEDTHNKSTNISEVNQLHRADKIVFSPYKFLYLKATRQLMFLPLVLVL